MARHVLHIAADNGCVYLYDTDTNTMRKVSDVTSMSEIPDDVRNVLWKCGLRVKLGEVMSQEDIVSMLDAICGADLLGKASDQSTIEK